MEPLRIAAFLDGTPGHEKQTRGVLQALAERTAARIEYLPLAPRSLWTQFISLFACAIGRPRGPKEHGRPKQVDLIVGTGTRTHLPMVRFKQQQGGRIVTCMTPDCYVRRHIDLCLVPLHDPVKPGDNRFVTIGPPGTTRNARRHDRRKGMVLIGGIDTKSHVWDTQAVMDQVSRIVEQSPGIRWTLASSPRTPESMLRQLAAFAGRHGRVRFFDSRETPPGWIENAYAENRTVWVTADSISMVYEALNAGCRVGVLPVRWRRDGNKFQRSIEYLVEKQGVVTYDMWLRGRHPVPGPPLDEAGRCAVEILRRWWPERL